MGQGLDLFSMSLSLLLRNLRKELIFFLLSGTTGIRELAPPQCKEGPSCATVPMLIKECMRSQSREGGFG